jgi:hypothetical protein
MANCEKILAKARNSPSGLRFEEARQLAECLGFTFIRSRGSHFYYKAPGIIEPLNLQEVDGKAKAYQVRRMIRLYDERTNQAEVDDQDS